MTKLARLVDFQVYARPTGLASGEQRAINQALFATYEPVRLWLKEHAISAPFRKLVVSFADETSSARWHGNVANAAGVCEVTEAVASPVLSKSAGDHAWVLGVVEHALSCVAAATNWRSEELREFIAATSKKPSPLVHFFEGLAQMDSVSGMKCVPWLSTRPGETRIGVRLLSRDKLERDVTIRSQSEPIYLEDSFPVAKSAIRRPDFVMLDKAGKVLASVPIEHAALH